MDENRINDQENELKEEEEQKAEEEVIETAESEIEVQPECSEEENRLIKQLEECEKQRDEYLDMARRTQAEFSNYRKRNQQVRSDALDEGVREVLTALLPTIDNLERALNAAEEASDDSPLAKGVRMIGRQLLEEMSKLGLEEVPALGEKFDPELHNAVMRAEEGEPGTVLEVFQKGYRARGKMIRYAMVKVAAE